MKKQNGMNKLAFNKAAVAELNNVQMNDVNGGSTPAALVYAGLSSNGCILAAGIAVGYALDWLADQ